VDGLKDVFGALVELIKFVDGFVSLFVKIDEHRDRKRKTTRPVQVVFQIPLESINVFGKVAE
jgi:ABC-type dipeptide/oligopeptide/nickel transport system ATPase subunit